MSSTSINKIYNLRRPPCDSHGSCLKFGMRKLGSLALSYMYQLTDEKKPVFCVLVVPLQERLELAPLPRIVRTTRCQQTEGGSLYHVHAMRARYRTFGPSTKSIVCTVQQYFFRTNSHQLHWPKSPSVS